MAEDTNIGEARTGFEFIRDDERDLSDTQKIALESMRRFEAQKAVITLEDALQSGDSTLTVNILRAWDAERIRRFALHLLGDDFQALLVAAREWREADKKVRHAKNEYCELEGSEGVSGDELIKAYRVFTSIAENEHALRYALRAAVDRIKEGEK